MELLEVYDFDGNKTGRIIVRGNKDLAEGECIKLVTIWIKSKDKYLIQKCNKEKGGEYAVTGGHVTSGNTTVQQAVLECKEELNLNLDKNKLKFLGNVFKEHAIFDVYIYEDENLLKYKFQLQKEEVESVSWKTMDEIDELCKDNVFRTSSKIQFAKFIKKQCSN